MKHRKYKTFKCKTKDLEMKLHNLEHYGWKIHSWNFVNKEHEVVILAYRHQTSIPSPRPTDRTHVGGMP